MTVAMLLLGLAPALPANASSPSAIHPVPGGSQTAAPQPAIRLSASSPLSTSADVTRRAAATSWVTRTGAGLSVGSQPFRFSGANLYWLALDDNMPSIPNVGYPSDFAIDDAMTTAAGMGATVVRAWADTVGCALCIEPSLGVFNPSAFRSLDYAVASAHRHGIRLVLTLVDNWAYYNGGKLSYTDWRGVGEAAFFTDPTVIADYETFIHEVVSHVDHYTGLAYGADPTIMAWETGNEVWCQTCAGGTAGQAEASWTAQIASYIKSVAPQQLVVDGLGTDPLCQTGCLDTAALSTPAVDLVDDHFYPMQTARVLSASAEAASYGKAYIIGEYDWANHDGGDSLGSFLTSVEHNAVAGDLFWVLIPHTATTGFQDHNDGFQFDFADSSADMASRIVALRDHAYVMAGTAIPAPPIPAAPQMRSVAPSGGGVHIMWRGTAGAATYTLQRSSDGGSTWSTVATGLVDIVDTQPGGWSDPNPGPTASYRIAGNNIGGVAGNWSGPMGAREADGR